MIAGARSWWHMVRRGHWPERVELGPTTICLTCDVGTPRTPRIGYVRPIWAPVPMS